MKTSLEPLSQMVFLSGDNIASQNEQTDLYASGMTPRSWQQRCALIQLTHFHLILMGDSAVEVNGQISNFFLHT